MKIRCKYALLCAVLLLFGCQRVPEIDALGRSKADGMNREAFLSRYRDPQRCITLSDSALRFIQDSLPHYVDGQLRACNNKAFAYFLTSDYGNADLMLSHVDKLLGLHHPTERNGDIEAVIRDLLKARLLQRKCCIADSYRLLYDIGRRGILEHNRDNILYSYAQTEYYITLLTLNFHYRDGKEADVRELLHEVEALRPNLKVDYAQDMALNYALAYGWQSAGESLTALDYCDHNYQILDRTGADLYHLANTMQMEALALKSLPGEVHPDSVLALYNTARETFFEYGDPYQMLGGVTSTARYALLIGDTALAHSVLREWIELRGVWTPFAAPKMELGLFDVLIRSRVAKTPDEARRWYERYAELQEYIKQNEKEDFALQQHLVTLDRRNRWMTRTAMMVSALLIVLLVLTALLWLSHRRLRREKQQLEEAKRRDVERIANVETCLSVMRHDISPFIGYLRNPNLTPELRSEVLEQLLRTFDNIKSWTSLSIPSGLAFSASTFPLQEVLDDVRRQVISPTAGVSLKFEPTDLTLWGDRLLVTILLRNLVNNALQHTASGSVTITATAEEGGMVRLSVADTGSGMTAERVENLFNAARPDGDHGFGLILCRYIVKKHDDHTRRGCKIWAESKVGEGTQMHCLLASKKQ